MSIIVEDWVEKKGPKFISAWKRRWLVLYSTNVIEYFQDKEKTNLCGQISLRSNNAVYASTETGNNFEHAFHLDTETRVWQFVSSTRAERDVWVENIKVCLEIMNGRNLQLNREKINKMQTPSPTREEKEKEKDNYSVPSATYELDSGFSPIDVSQEQVYEVLRCWTSLFEFELPLEVQRMIFKFSNVWILGIKVYYPKPGQDLTDLESADCEVRVIEIMDKQPRHIRSVCEEARRSDLNPCTFYMRFETLKPLLASFRLRISYEMLDRLGCEPDRLLPIPIDKMGKKLSELNLKQMDTLICCDFPMDDLDRVPTLPPELERELHIGQLVDVLEMTGKRYFPGVIRLKMDDNSLIVQYISVGRSMDSPNDFEYIESVERIKEVDVASRLSPYGSHLTISRLRETMIKRDQIALFGSYSDAQYV